MDPAYKRFEPHFDSKPIEETTFVISGFGRAGFRTFKSLLNYPMVKRIIAVDDDVVTEEQIPSLFPHDSKGLPKVEVARGIVQWNPELMLIPVKEKISITLLEQIYSKNGKMLLVWACDAWQELKTICDVFHGKFPMIGFGISEQGRYTEVAWSNFQTPCLAGIMEAEKKTSASDVPTLPFDEEIMVNIGIQIMFGLALAGNRGFDRFNALLDPNYPLLICINRENKYFSAANPEIPMQVRMYHKSKLHLHENCRACSKHRKS